MMSFTPSQTEAIHYRDGSVLVSAGAGSGKTRVLTERLMNYIAPVEKDVAPAELDAFLIITFTRAAAAELRGRIASAITDRLRSEPDNAHLRRQLMLNRNAQICTIHAFCADLLREQAAQAGISPAFRILEEERTERMLAAALDRVLERHYMDGSPAFRELSATVGAGRDDTRLFEQILQLHAAIQSHANPAAWVKEQIALMESEYADFSVTPWGEELLKDTERKAAFWADEMERCLALARQTESGRKIFMASLTETAAALRRLQQSVPNGWDSTRACLPIPFPRIGRVKDDPDADLTAWIKERREACKKSIEAIRRNVSSDSEEVLHQLRQTAPAMSLLLTLTMELEHEFQMAKKRVNGLDFNDLEHRTLSLLRTPEGEPTELARQISGRYTEIMVDEYQDVSRVQDQLFHAVSKAGQNLFFVGDVKQSIYRFRLADPSIFIEKCELYEADSSHSDQGELSGEKAPGRLIRLQENFRSRGVVLDAVNRTFRRCMSKDLGGLDYGPFDELIPGASYSGTSSNPEIILLQREEAENGALEAEAEAAASRIQELMHTMTVEKDGSFRPLRYSDIAVLLRAANSVGNVFRRVFIKHGIPVSSSTAGDFYGSVEVSTVFAMLDVMDNPHQDIPLLTLLRSPCLNFTEEQLSIIRALRPDADLYTALCESKDPDAVSFLRRLHKLRQEAEDRHPAELTERTIEDLDLYAVCSAMPDSGQRLHRLAVLIQLAESFRKSGEYGLHHFIIWLRNLEQRGEEPPGGSGDGNAVQILSIHKSKGLEFPVVFCCGLGRLFNKQDVRNTVLLHPELGLGPYVTDPVRKIEYPSAVRRAVEVRLNRETLSEEMRLLYVAMTRAREQLILTACVKKLDERLQQTKNLIPPGVEKGSYPEKIPAELLKNASCPLCWVLPALVFDRAFVLKTDLNCSTVEPARDGAENGDEATVSDLEALLEKNITWRYPHAAAETLPSKVTPTELKVLQYKPDPEIASTAPSPQERVHILLPDLKEKLSAARFGSAAHLVLQNISFHKTESINGITDEIQRMLQQNFLTPEEAQSVKPEMIFNFFQSGLGRRMARASRCWREFRFSLMSEADEVFLGTRSEDRILVQGVVDAFFEENGSLVLVDYKTDRVESDAMLQQRTELYRSQLDTYAKALERIFGLPVCEKILVFLYAGHQVLLE